MNGRVLIDANLPRSLSGRLRAAGVDVLDLRELHQADATDEVGISWQRPRGACW